VVKDNNSLLSYHYKMTLLSLLTSWLSLSVIKKDCMNITVSSEVLFDVSVVQLQSTLVETMSSFTDASRTWDLLLHTRHCRSNHQQALFALLRFSV